MKKFLCLFLAVGSFFLVAGCGEKEKEEEKKPCEPITGGSYNIIFVTNDANPIQNMNVCIACAPGTYEDLPVLENGYLEFEGWYYDAELTKKVDATNSIDVVASPITAEDNKDCVTGYNDITLYAKWEER